MAAATERIPIPVTKVDKTRSSQKAKSFGFDSISHFAHTAMEHFRPVDDEAALIALLDQIKVGTKEAEQSLARTIAYCDASNQRINALDSWMKKKWDA